MKKIVIAVIVAAFIAGGSCSNSGSKAKPADTGKQPTETAAATSASTLKVEGACGMCKTRIEAAAKSVEGVSDVAWNGETKTLTFALDTTKTTVDALSKAIAKTGHDTGNDKADDAVYDALPGCCKYRK